MIKETYTIQIQTSHLDFELSDKECELVAIELLDHFKKLVKDEGLQPYVDCRASWMRGCVIENIILTVKDMDAAAQALSALGTYVVLRDYSAISDSVSRMASHLRAAHVYLNKKRINIVGVVVNRHKSPDLKNKIEPSIGDLKDVGVD